MSEKLNTMVAFHNEPTPANAVALAITDHKGGSGAANGCIDRPFIEALELAQAQLRQMEAKRAMLAAALYEAQRFVDKYAEGLEGDEEGEKEATEANRVLRVLGQAQEGLR